MTALALLTGTRVMTTLTQRWSSRSSSVVFNGINTPWLTPAGKMSLTTCCWAAMMSSMFLEEVWVSTAAIVSAFEQRMPTVSMILWWVVVPQGLVSR